MDARHVRADGHARLEDLRVSDDAFQSRREEVFLGPPVDGTCGLRSWAEEGEVEEGDACFGSDLNERHPCAGPAGGGQVGAELDVEAEDGLVEEQAGDLLGGFEGAAVVDCYGLGGRAAVEGGGEEDFGALGVGVGDGGRGEVVGELGAGGVVGWRGC